MFLGHFAVGLIAKPAAPRVSLPVLLVAPQLLDVLWPIFVSAGIEEVHIKPGITRVMALDLVHIPWSHSLVMTIVWSLLFGLGYLALRGDRRGALILGLCVASHWVLDYATHRPDMPLSPGSDVRVGLGLWNSLPGTLAVELGMFAAGLWLYLGATQPRDRRGRLGFAALAGTLLVIYFGSIFGPPPPSERALTASAFAGWILIAFAWWVDRHRELAPELRSALAGGPGGRASPRTL
jgi:membrane-bound metal-dependent hydrolase YbcI (DUF457 family)